MEVYEFIICVLVPALLGGGLVYQFQGEDVSAAIWTGVIILLLASIISSVIIGMLDEALSSIFIFYCFDKKFHEMGMQVNNVPEEIKQLFQEGENSESAQKARQKLYEKDDWSIKINSILYNSINSFRNQRYFLLYFLASSLNFLNVLFWIQ